MADVIEVVNDAMQRAGGPLPAWGPWSPDLIDPAERKAQMRQIATLVHILLPPASPDRAILVRAFCEAEGGAPDYARYLFDKLPALIQRRIIATIAEMTKLGRSDIENKSVVVER